MGLRNNKVSKEQLTLLEIFLEAGYSIPVSEENAVYSRFMQAVADYSFNIEGAESDDIVNFLSDHEEAIFHTVLLEDFIDPSEY